MWPRATGKPPPSSLPAAAAAIHALAPALREEVDKAGVAARLYRDRFAARSCPLSHGEGRRSHRHELRSSGLSDRFGSELTRVGERIFELAGQTVQYQFAEATWRGVIHQPGTAGPARAAAKTKAVSTAQDVLESLAEKHDVPRLVLEYRHLAKLKSNYVDALPLLADAESRVHTTFQAAATATGRLSSVNPNLQNIPVRTELGREIRAAFTAAPGTQLLSADYSQIELRLLAHFSGDPLLDARLLRRHRHSYADGERGFRRARDTMDKETRSRAKAVNFGIVYGISAFGLAAQLGIPQAEAKAYIERYFARYQGVQRFIEKTLEQTRKDGFVRTMFGRMRPIPDIESRNPNQRGFAERTAINTPLQGTGADLIKLAMISLDRKLAERKLKTRMVLQVHDELLFEVPLDETDEVAQVGAGGDGRRGEAERAAGCRSFLRAELARPEVSRRTKRPDRAKLVNVCLVQRFRK